MADDILEEEGHDCACDYEQFEYEGMFDCQRQMDPSWFRQRFISKDYRTNKVKWDQIKAQHAVFHPAIMCDPCATAPVINSTNSFERKEATGITLKSMFTISCGEMHEEIDMIRPGVECNNITSPEEAVRDILARKALLQSEGFDDIEECLAAELFLTQRIELPKSDYLPEGAAVWFPRDEELNCTTDQCFGKGQCDTKGILRRWLNKIECHEGGARPTDVLMHCETWEEFLMGDDMQECLKGFNAQAILGASTFAAINQQSQQLITPRGVTLVWVSPEGIRFWKVNLQKKFCTETGEIKKYELLPKNKLFAYDLSGGRCSYQPVWGYTPIHDLKKLINGSVVTNSNQVRRFVKNTCTFEPANYKQVMQSNILPYIPNPNGSTTLTLCVAENKEKFELKQNQNQNQNQNKNANNNKGGK